MIFISIGLQCTNATIFRDNNIRSEAFPFDWMFAHPRFVYEMLNLLLIENIPIEELVVKHFFLCDKRCSLVSQEHFITNAHGPCLYNSLYDVIFPHDVYSSETIDKYIRRFYRLKETIINSTEKINFIYSSQSSYIDGNYTIDGREVINNVYYYINEIYNIISSIRSNFNVIIFDAINREDTNILHAKIQLIRINSCNCWADLVPQIIPHIKDLQ